MHHAKLVLAGIFCMASALAQAAGVTTVNVPADAAGPAIRAVVWSPCATPAGEVKIGSRVLPGVADCPIAGEHLPLVVISHGHGGSYSGHHDTAEALADAGFVVAALNHPGDTFADMSHAGDISALVERPLVEVAVTSY